MDQKGGSMTDYVLRHDISGGGKQNTLEQHLGCDKMQNILNVLELKHGCTDVIILKGK